MNKKKKQILNSGKSSTIKENTRKPEGSEDGKKNTLLFKNELLLILFGAGLVTLIVFFIFFNPSIDKTPKLSQKNTDIKKLEQRISNIEKLINQKTGAEAVKPSSPESYGNNGTNPSLKSYEDRVERVEAALSMKFDTLTKRLDSLSKRLSILSKKVNRQYHYSRIKKTSSTKLNSSKTKKITHKKYRDTRKHHKTRNNKTTIHKKSSIFHVVKKGETLYRISRKYKISVSKLRALNKLTKKSVIYPGEMLIVK